MILAGGGVILDSWSSPSPAHQPPTACHSSAAASAANGKQAAHGGGSKRGMAAGHAAASDLDLESDPPTLAVVHPGLAVTDRYVGIIMYVISGFGFVCQNRQLGVKCPPQCSSGTDE